MIDDLRTFLIELAARPFQWGGCDCSLAPCEWIARRRGAHPAAHLIGAYDDAMSCARLLRREGGLIAVASGIAAAAGLERVEAPAPGDIVAVRINARRWLGLALGVISPAGRVMCKAPIGIVAVPSPPLVIWRV